MLDACQALPGLPTITFGWYDSPAKFIWVLCKIGMISYHISMHRSYSIRWLKLLGFQGLLVAQVFLFFSLKHEDVVYPCTLIWIQQLIMSLMRILACGLYSLTQETMVWMSFTWIQCCEVHILLEWLIQKSNSQNHWMLSKHKYTDYHIHEIAF